LFATVQPSDDADNAIIAQRIDGTEAEQSAIKKVLQQMDDYFYNEVMSLPEYEGIRDKWYVRLTQCDLRVHWSCSDRGLILKPFY
jgi:hypothetical protein